MHKCKKAKTPKSYSAFQSLLIFKTLFFQHWTVFAVHETYHKCIVEQRYSPRTFAGDPGHGSGMECWRRVTAWAAASPKSLRAEAGAAGSRLSAPPHLPARQKHNHRKYIGLE